MHAGRGKMKECCKKMFRFTGALLAVSAITCISVFPLSETYCKNTENIFAQTAEAVSIKSMTPTQGPVVSADITGGSGFTFPVFNGDESVKFENVADDIRLFVRTDENSEWVSIDNNADSGWIYDSNFGHFWDGPGGFWFHVNQTTFVRLQSAANPDVHLDYTIVFERSADYDQIEMGTSESPELSGWNLIWNDEFSEDVIDRSKWTNETGYYLTDDPNTWGWGNNELEHYTDSEKNTFACDGKLSIRILEEPKTFEQDPGRVAPYSSGKLISKDKFSFRYGRIDFCAKLPTGTGIWPALWMLPNDSVYGTWAASGEIDVMESKDRINNTVYGTVHYGGAWPANAYTGNQYTFKDGKTYDDGFHIYSCIWEKEKIRWYVDGECFSVVPYTNWYSAAAENNPYAPFDEEFYIIMNLAAGGNFDGGRVPDASSVPCEMQVDYVRVYQAEGDPTASFTDNSGNNPSEPEIIDAAFALKLQRYFLGAESYRKAFDFDGNGKVDITDMIKVKSSLLN